MTIHISLSLFFFVLGATALLLSRHQDHVLGSYRGVMHGACQASVSFIVVEKGTSRSNKKLLGQLGLDQV